MAKKCTQASLLFERAKAIFAKGEELKKENAKELYQIKQKIGRTMYDLAMKEGFDILYPSTKQKKVLCEKIVYY